MISVFLLLGLAAFAHRNWFYLTEPPVAQLHFPGTSALWVLHQNMLFHDGVERLPRTAQAALVWLGIGAGDPVKDCEAMLRDTIACLDPGRGDPAGPDHLRANLIILLAERSSLSNAQSELPRLSPSNAANQFRDAFAAAYGTNVMRHHGRTPVPELELLSGWAAWRFSARWLSVTGQSAELKEHLASIAYGERRQIWPPIMLFTLAGVVQMAGLLAGLLWATNSSFRRVLPPALAGPPWSAREYWGLFSLGYLLGLISEWCFIHAPGFGQLAWLNHCLFWGLPTLLLLGWRHWIRDPVSFREFFGIPLRPQSAVGLALAAVILFAVAWGSLAWVPAFVDALGFKSHWAESYDEVLRDWPWVGKFLYLCDGMIYGPFFEEIIYRGLLFGALRRRFSAYPAAALSAVIFGGTHFYSLPGFLGVTCFGFCCAVAREKTGSLLPSIAVHMFTNFILFGSATLTSL